MVSEDNDVWRLRDKLQLSRDWYPFPPFYNLSTAVQMWTNVVAAALERSVTHLQDITEVAMGVRKLRTQSDCLSIVRHRRR